MVIDPECLLLGEEMSFVVEELKEEKSSQLNFLIVSISCLLSKIAYEMVK